MVNLIPDRYFKDIRIIVDEIERLKRMKFYNENGELEEVLFEGEISESDNYITLNRKFKK